MQQKRKTQLLETFREIKNSLQIIKDNKVKSKNVFKKLCLTDEDIYFLQEQHVFNEVNELINWLQTDA